MSETKGFNKSEKIFWQKILSEFSDITGLEANIVDSTGNILIKTSEDKAPPRYCHLILDSEKGCRECKESYANLAKNVIKTKEPQIQECHAKLINLGIPFTSSNKKNYIIVIHYILDKKIGKELGTFAEKIAKKFNLKKNEIESSLSEIGIKYWIKDKSVCRMLCNLVTKLEQLITIEEMEKDISTIYDEEEIFKFILGHCVDLMKVDAIIIGMIDNNNNLQYVKGYNINEDIINTFKIPLEVAFIERSIMEDNKTFQVSDVEKKKRFTHIFVLQTKIKSFMAAPIKYGNQNMGILYACRFKPHKYEKSEHILLMSLSDIIANAFKKIHDHKELKENSERFELIRRIMDKTFPILTLNELLTKIVEITSEIMNVENCEIFLRENPSEKKIICRAACGELRKEVNTVWYDLGEGLTGWIAKHGEIINTDNVLKDARWKGKYKKNIGNYLGVPIYDNQEKYIQGVIKVSNKKINPDMNTSNKNFLKGDEYLLTMVAKHISLAIDRNKLLEATQENSRLNLLRQIIPGIAHNLRYPLSQLIGYIKTFEKDTKFKEYADEMQDVEKLIFHLLLMIQNYMHFDFSITQKDLLEIFDLNQAIIEIENELMNINYFENIEFIKKLTEMPTQIMGIKPTIKIALSNMIVNAIDSIKRKKGKKIGKVQISTERFLDNIKILISDTGEGIHIKNHEEIYRPFFTSKDSRGIGIGLTITRKIIEEYNGSIKFISPGILGVGTTFEIHIPCTQGYLV
ncbi:PocR ligand-binding domain-containing protein [Candidatus Poribacteria bacterium]|nr:PocR ligand-binding domain-containing protein [Candidatus Poribacteria bacterium]